MEIKRKFAMAFGRPVSYSVIHGVLLQGFARKKNILDVAFPRCLL